MFEPSQSELLVESDRIHELEAQLTKYSAALYAISVYQPELEETPHELYEQCDSCDRVQEHWQHKRQCQRHQQIHRAYLERNRRLEADQHLYMRDIAVAALAGEERRGMRLADLFIGEYSGRIYLNTPDGPVAQDECDIMAVLKQYRAVITSLESQLEETTTQSRIDREQCDRMTKEAGEMAQKLREVEGELAHLRKVMLAELAQWLREMCDVDNLTDRVEASIESTIDQLKYDAGEEE